MSDRWGYCRIQGELRKLASGGGKHDRQGAKGPPPGTGSAHLVANVLARALGRGSLPTSSRQKCGLGTCSSSSSGDGLTLRVTTTPEPSWRRRGQEPTRGGWVPSGAPFRNLRPRAKFTAEFRRILQAVGVRVIRTPRRPELQRSRGAICAVDQVRVFADDVLRRSVVASRCWRIPSALPPGATAPGARERDARFRAAVHGGGASTLGVRRVTRVIGQL